MKDWYQSIDPGAVGGWLRLVEGPAVRCWRRSGWFGHDNCGGCRGMLLSGLSVYLRDEN